MGGWLRLQKPSIMYMYMYLVEYSVNFQHTFVILLLAISNFLVTYANTDYQSLLFSSKI